MTEIIQVTLRSDATASNLGAATWHIQLRLVIILPGVVCCRIMLEVDQSSGSTCLQDVDWASRSTYL